MQNVTVHSAFCVENLSLFYLPSKIKIVFFTYCFFFGETPISHALAFLMI